MQFYVGTWVGNGTTDEFRPRGTDGIVGSWSCVDLRPDASIATGRCLLALPDGAPDPAQAFALGTDLDAPFTAPQIAQINSALGVTLPAGATRRSAIVDLLTVWGGAVGKWKKLVPTLQPGGLRRVQLFLGNQAITDQPLVQGGATFTETWNYADQSGWGSTDLTWTVVTGAAGNIKSNQGSAPGGLSFYKHASTTSGNDNQAECDAATMELSTNSIVGPGVRQSGGDFYYGTRRGNTTLGTFSCTIQKLVGGSSSTLATAASVARAALGTSERVKVTVSGSTLTVYLDGVQKLQTTDTSIVTGTGGGGRFQSAVADTTRFDNYAFGDITSGSAVSLAASIPTASSLKLVSVLP